MAATGIPAATLAFYEDHQSTTPIHEQWEWLDWVAELSQHDFTDCVPCPGGQHCKKKYALAFSPGVPRQGTTRANDNVEYVSMLVFDFDHLERAELEALCDRIASLEAFLYSTHSHLHGGPNDCCVRLMFPLSRPLKPSEFRAVRNAVIAKYGFEWRRGHTLVGADPAPKDLSRLYFMPTAPIGNEVEFGRQEGALLDLDELLKGVRIRPSAPRLTLVSPNSSPPASGPPPPAFGPPLAPPVVDMDLLRNLLKGYDPDPNPNEDDEHGERISKKELVRRVCKGEPLVRPDEGDVRNSACHRIAKILALNLPLEIPEEAIMEFLRKSVSTMPVGNWPSETDAVNDRFRTISNSWNKGVTARKARIAADRALVQRIRRFKVGRRSAPSDVGNVDVDPSSPPPSPASGGGGDGDGGGDEPMTQEKLDDLLHHVMTKNGLVLLDFIANVILILSLRPEWEDALKYNEITKNVELKKSPLHDWETKPAQVVTGVQAWLQHAYVTNFKYEVVERALVHVAKSNSYNPLQDYLNGVQGDSRSRVDTFLETYCGAALKGVDGTDITEYVRKVSRRWLVSAVARGLSPGCKMDTVLILEGRTGIYKSTALKALAGPFFSDSKIVIGEKDAMQLAGTNWIHEIAELTAFHASETETQKAFFSSPVDQFRAPYDRVADKYPRLACFVGSTNDERYMNDHTGNRRYWPIQCERMFRIQELRRDRDLIWAEAVKIYKAGIGCLKCQALNVGLPDPWYEQYAHKRCELHRWWFEDEENESLEKINLHRLRAEFSDAIRDYILRIDPKNRKKSYSFFEIAVDMLKLPAERINSQSAAIGRALKVLGFTKARELEAGEQIRRHVTPELILNGKHKKSAFQEMHEKRKEENVQGAN